MLNILDRRPGDPDAAIGKQNRDAVPLGGAGTIRQPAATADLDIDASRNRAGAGGASLVRSNLRRPTTSFWWTGSTVIQRRNQSPRWKSSRWTSTKARASSSATTSRPRTRSSRDRAPADIDPTTIGWKAPRVVPGRPDLNGSSTATATPDRPSGGRPRRRGVGAGTRRRDPHRATR